MDTVSNGLLLVCVALWWAFVSRHAHTWAMEIRYDVSTMLPAALNAYLPL